MTADGCCHEFCIAGAAINAGIKIVVCKNGGPIRGTCVGSAPNGNTDVCVVRLVVDKSIELAL